MHYAATEPIEEKQDPSQQPGLISTPTTICRFLSPFTTCLPCLSSPFQSKSKSKTLYFPLSPPDSIRLLHIHPGNVDEEIRCSLKPARLNHKPPQYEALSYVWALKPGFRTIVLNGCQVEVTTNLFEALQRLRPTPSKKTIWGAKARTVWVDALCMNQALVQERNDQVSIMCDIYRRATRVIVWLGTDEYAEAEKAFGILSAMVAAEKPIEGTQAGKSNKRERKEVVKVPPLGSKAWLPVMALFINTWWTRMWVLQEIVLAQSATFLWGSFSLPWDTISAAIPLIRSNPKLHATLESKQFQNAFFMHHLRSVDRSALTSTHPFLHLLDLGRNFDVTDCKDKIYGLLGLSVVMRDAGEGKGGGKEKAEGKAKGKLFVEPDYGKSLAEIYTEVARKLIVEGGSLDVLSFAVHAVAGSKDGEKVDEKKEKEPEALPSWVPNWSAKNIVYPFAGLGPKSKHSAGLDRPMKILPSERGVLRVCGMRLDTVMSVAEPMPLKNIYEINEEVRRVVEWCLEPQYLDCEGEKGGRPRVSAEILANVLTAGRQANGALIKDPDHHLADFLAYLQEVDESVTSKAWPEQSQVLSKVTRNGNPDRAREAIFKATRYRSVFVTEEGRLGLGSWAMREGDAVVVLWGGQVPFALREETDGEGCGFVGECFVDGYMDGEGLERFLGGEEGKVYAEGLDKALGEGEIENAEVVYELR